MRLYIRVRVDVMPGLQQTLYQGKEDLIESVRCTVGCTVNCVRRIWSDDRRVDEEYRFIRYVEMQFVSE